MKLPFIRTLPEVDKKEPVLALTPMGQQEVETFSGSGPGFRVMAILAEKGAVKLGTIAEQLGSDRDTTKALLNKLIKEQLVTRVQ